MSLQETTIKIKQMIDDLHEQFIKAEDPADTKSLEFFHKVKSETAPMFELTSQWLEEAEEFVKSRSVSVHPNQVKSTHENIEMLILHSYYHDVERKRFKELHQSSHYVLDMVLNDLEK
ncbi:DUF1798 family protein [Halobacillus hunanensis]|uniref:DUF1798 family protein n=1 Tax=Halobacillus hunanensis TaxID=578214 RepID=UPI0009A560F6|nr:DUF1798 family protein [Halobacillus hunanensis]